MFMLNSYKIFKHVSSNYYATYETSAAEWRKCTYQLSFVDLFYPLYEPPQIGHTFLTLKKSYNILHSYCHVNHNGQWQVFLIMSNFFVSPHMSSSW